MEYLHLHVRPNEGYAPDQVIDKSTLTVGELREALEGLDDDMPILIENVNNRYGANWGTLTHQVWEDRTDDGDDE